jgi:predicted enzyme related to lactoylglutathione lyase
MIVKHSHSCVYVLDQDRAKEFYTEKLGFEVRDDVKMGAFRWLTVAPKTQPDACIILMGLQPGPMMDQESVDALKTLLRKGVLGGGVLSVDDCRGTYDELKAKGVEFMREPKEMPYGIEALMRDDSGNFYSMTQHRK